MGPPEVGEAVQVKWPDGLFYGAKYLGSNVSYMYQVHTRTVFIEKVYICLWEGQTRNPALQISSFSLCSCEYIIKLASSVMGQSDTAVNLCNSLNVRIILTLLMSSRSPRFMHGEEKGGREKGGRHLRLKVKEVLKSWSLKKQVRDEMGDDRRLKE